MTIISKVIKGFNTSENRETYKKMYGGCKYIFFTFIVCVLLYLVGNIFVILGQIAKDNPRWTFKKDEPNIGIGFVVFFIILSICAIEFLHGLMYVFFVASARIETNEICENYVKNKKIYILETSTLHYGTIEKGKGCKYSHDYIFYSDLYRIIFSYVINTTAILYATYNVNRMLMIVLPMIGSIFIDMCILLVTIICRVIYMVVVKSQ